MKRFLFLLVLSLSLLSRVFGQVNETKTKKVIIENVTIINPIKPYEQKHMSLIIDHGYITFIGHYNQSAKNKNLQVINGKGRFLIPGLWDMHTHLEENNFDKESVLKLFIINGVTGIRIMNGLPEHHLWKKQISAGKLLGPTMFIGSRYIGFPNLVSDSKDAKAKVRVAKEEGADFIKVHDSISKIAYYSIIKEARNVKLPVEGHVPYSITAGLASYLGQKSIEHFTGLDKASNSSKIAKRVIDTLIKFRTWVCPTLIMRHSYTILTDSNLLQDYRLKYLQSNTTGWWLNMVKQSKEIPDIEWQRRKQLVSMEDKLLFKMKKREVGILAGTDNGNPFCYPGFSLHDELGLMVQAGLTPLQALQTATINAAIFFNISKTVGTIEKGKLANLILLSGNPLKDINNTKKISVIFLKGQCINRQKLDEMLLDIEHSAKE